LPILLNFLSIPAPPGPAAEFLRLPHFHGEKTRAAREYSQLDKGTQVKMPENWAKMKIFLWHCGFSSQKQRFLRSAGKFMAFSLPLPRNGPDLAYFGVVVEATFLSRAKSRDQGGRLSPPIPSPLFKKSLTLQHG